MATDQLMKDAKNVSYFRPLVLIQLSKDALSSSVAVQNVRLAVGFALQLALILLIRRGDVVVVKV